MKEGWKIVRIEDVCSTKPQYGYTTKGASEGNWRLLRTTDITKGKINWDTVPFCSDDPDNPDKYELKEGDIVISRAGSVGVSYLIEKPQKSVFASYLIRFNPNCDKKYFKYFLDSPLYWQAIADNKLGIAVPNVNATKLKNIKLPLPPRANASYLLKLLWTNFTGWNKISARSPVIMKVPLPVFLRYTILATPLSLTILYPKCSSYSWLLRLVTVTVPFRWRLSARKSLIGYGSFTPIATVHLPTIRSTAF